MSEILHPHHRIVTNTASRVPASVADIESFIDTIRAACANQQVNHSLTEILLLPDPDRRELLRNLINNLQSRNAPKKLTQALACLVSDQVAHKAYELIVDK